MSAIDVALRGRERRIDAGELDGRLFFNVAGIGLDARVAHRFAADGLVQRGFRRYAALTAAELFTYKPDYHTIVTDGRTLRARTLLIAIANARQYGNGALIAPEAQLDDGRLAAFVYRTNRRSSRRHSPAGARDRKSSAGPMIYHVDGELFISVDLGDRALVRCG